VQKVSRFDCIAAMKISEVMSCNILAYDLQSAKPSFIHNLTKVNESIEK
jgi:hypothetical protein